MRLRDLARAVAALALLPASLSGQTSDQPRLVFTVSGGYVGPDDLWRVPRQPIDYVTPADTFDLERRIRSTLGIGLSGAYFPREHLGFVGEAFLIGLGYEDGCRHVYASGASQPAAACRSLQGREKSATAVVVSAGVVGRVASRRPVSPYGRASLGLVFSTQSPVRTIGTFPSNQGDVALVVYDDDHDSRVEPALLLGVGFTAAIAPGYQLRAEVRDNIVGVQRVARAAPTARVVPSHERSFRHLFSLTFGFDVVLERRRGRRY